MSTRILPFALVLVLSSCIKQPRPIPVEDDKTITFPPFFARAAEVVSANGEPYELDGTTFRAITIAANDLLSPGDEPRACPNRQEAHLYRVIREGNIVFVYVYQNPQYCGPEHLLLDSGAKYAISTDGRILRRVLDGQPEESPHPVLEDGGLGVPSKPGVTPAYDAVWNQTSQTQSSGTQDGEREETPDGGSADASR